MRVGVRHHIGVLADDMTAIVPRAKKDMRGTVREGLKVGTDLARGNARRTSGKHAKKYPRTITAETYGALSALSGGGLYAGEYGPEPRGQGKLAPILEGGSRNNPAHGDLKRSADVVGPSFAQEVRQMSERWFW